MGSGRDRVVTLFLYWLFYFSSLLMPWGIRCTVASNFQCISVWSYTFLSQQYFLAFLRSWICFRKKVKSIKQSNCTLIWLWFCHRISLYDTGCEPGCKNKSRMRLWFLPSRAVDCQGDWEPAVFIVSIQCRSVLIAGFWTGGGSVWCSRYG